MSIKQRGATWWLDIAAPGGQRIRRSTGTSNRREAQEYHDRLKADLWRQDKLGDAPERTFEEAALRMLQVYEGRKSYATKVRHVAFWQAQFAGRTLCSLTTDEILDALPTHAERKHQKRRPVTAATRNRYLSTIGRMLSLAAEWGWLAGGPKLRRAPEPKVRVRWATHEQARALLAAFSRAWIQDAAEFALLTGMRAGEILKLRWADVDLPRSGAWVTADHAKSGRARAVPLNAEAVAVIRRRIGTHIERVFTRNGKPQKQVDPKMFARACDRVGLADFHFHDLRHTWASWHVQAGTPLFVLKELGGWETLEMVKKYAHMDGATLAHWANHVTFTAQSGAQTKTATDKVAVNA
ncbi:MAG TPA: site-specific integrase [Castellaniella sp.]|uniref:tyrosine-type recombinase/integrase n=1 Tax=Castellaniella sp. TaxID=1955812 RepID=UPI002F258BA4